MTFYREIQVVRKVKSVLPVLLFFLLISINFNWNYYNNFAALIISAGVRIILCYHFHYSLGMQQLWCFNKQ